MQEIAVKTREIERALHKLRKVNAQLTVTQLILLLTIRRAGPVPVTELYRGLGLTQGSASRNLSALSGYRSSKLDLIDMREIPVDRRSKECRLTASGLRVVDEFIEDLYALGQERPQYE